MPLTTLRKNFHHLIDKVENKELLDQFYKALSFSAERKQKKFDSVKWTREVRDKFYKEHRNLKSADYLEAIRKSIRKDILSPEKDKRSRKNTKERV